jgi:hypothetical protein
VPVELHRRRSSGSWGPLLVLGVLVLGATPLLAPHFLNAPSAHTPAPGETRPAEATTAKKQFGIEQMPLAGPGSTARPVQGAPGRVPFELTGLVYSSGGSYCLINGKVVKQGESVGGATVERISQDEVTLDLNGEKITLPVTVA